MWFDAAQKAKPPNSDTKAVTNRANSRPSPVENHAYSFEYLAYIVSETCRKTTQ